MDITQRYITQAGRQFALRLRENERIADADPSMAFIRMLEVKDARTSEGVAVPASASRFSAYKNFTSFGGCTAIHYFGVRETAFKGLRIKILTRVEDHLERLG